MPGLLRYFNPNTLSTCVSPDPVKQAEVLDYMGRLLWGSKSFGGNEAQAFLIKPYSSSGFLEPISGDSFSECQERCPEGLWGIVVADVDTRKPETLEQVLFFLTATGELPSGIDKLAVFLSPSGRSWYSGFGLISESGIYLVSDFEGMFCPGTYDPAGVDDWGNDYIDNSIEMKCEGSRHITEEQYNMALAGYARTHLGVIDGSREEIAGFLEEGAPILSLGHMDSGDTLRQVMQRFPADLPSPTAYTFVPPAGHPAYSLVRILCGADALLPGWQGYLERFGVEFQWADDVPGQEANLAVCLRELACPELEEEIARISGGVDGRVDAMRAVLEMSMAGDIPDDVLPGVSYQDLDDISCSSPTVRQERFTRLQWNPGSPEESAVKRVISQLSGRLGIRPMSDSGDASYAAYCLLDGFWKPAALERRTDGKQETGKGWRWGAVLVPPGSPCQAADAVRCSIAAGMAQGYDAVIGFAWTTELEEEAIRWALGELEKGGFDVIAAYGGFRGFPETPEMVPRPGSSGDLEPTEFVLARREDASPEILAQLAPLAMTVAACRQLDPYSLPFSSPRDMTGLLPLLTGGRLLLDGVPLEPVRDPASLRLFSALEPLDKFFDVDVEVMSWAAKTVELWDRVLALNGLAFSSYFPAGVSVSCFGKLFDVLAMDKYLDALYAGVDIDDLAPACL